MSLLSSATASNTSAVLPDPLSLTSWQDAFTNYPIPTVRRLESALRQHTTEHRTKLRSLVGASYRDLLGTAERIIAMDAAVRDVEESLVDVGRKCHARRLEAVAGAYGRLRGEEDARAIRDGGEIVGRRRVVAVERIVVAALEVARREIKKRKTVGKGDALLAAKLIVLARVLVKSLGDAGKEVDELRKQVGLARKKLLSYIGRILVKADEDVAVMTTTLTAYSLITSSSPKDVLKYFLSVRFEQLESEAENANADAVLRMLELNKRTFLDTKAVFPRRISDSASQLGNAALVRDAQIRSVFELSLDVHEQWIADDVRHFTPWVRHEQLTSSETNEILKQWTSRAQKCLLEAIGEALDTIDECHTVVSVRQSVLASYLSLSSQTRATEDSIELDNVREKFLSRLEVLMSDGCRAPLLNLEPDSIKHTNTPNIWSIATDNTKLTGGAINLRQAVIQQSNGRGASVNRVTKVLNAWLARLDQFDSIIGTMRTAKWDEYFDLDDELSDPDYVQSLLSKQDPQRLETKYHEHVLASLRSIYSDIAITQAKSTSPSFAPLILRIIREVDHRRRVLASRVPSLSTVAVDADVVKKLHGRLAEDVFSFDPPLTTLLQTSVAKRKAHIALWDEGEPSLPVLPSPAAFKYLVELQRRMKSVGGDVWTADAVEQVRLLGQNAVVVGFDDLKYGSKNDGTNGRFQQDDVNGIDGEKAEASADDKVQAEDGKEASNDASPQNKQNGHVNGIDHNGNNATQHNTEQLNNSIQHLFDIVYLQHVFASSRTTDSELVSMIKSLEGRLESYLDESARKRLHKSANEYWKKTYLLFGLLAPARG